MIRVGFTGVPATGKTTAARMLSASFKDVDGVESIELVSEYARRYISKYDEITSVWDQLHIFDKQIEWETHAEKDTDLLITDSPVFIAFMYVLDIRSTGKKDTMIVNDLFKKMSDLNIPSRYDFVFHLPPILKPVDDGVRPKHHLDPVWREEADQTLKMCFKLFPPKNFIVLEEVSIESRVASCVKHIKNYLNEEINNGTEN